MKGYIFSMILISVVFLALVRVGIANAIVFKQQYSITPPAKKLSDSGSICPGNNHRMYGNVRVAAANFIQKIPEPSLYFSQALIQWVAYWQYLKKLDFLLRQFGFKNYLQHIYPSHNFW